MWVCVCVRVLVGAQAQGSVFPTEVATYFWTQRLQSFLCSAFQWARWHAALQ